MPPKIKESECAGCGACVDICPNNVLELVEGIAKVVHPGKCVDCWACVGVCPLGLIEEGKTGKSRKK